jgi:hypothetical protein
MKVNGSSHNKKQEYNSIKDSYLLGLDLRVLHIQDINDV